MIELLVRYGRETVGRVREDGVSFRFQYAPEWQRFPISQSVPIREPEYVGGAAHAFFANLLPEGHAREAVCRRLGISEGNDFELLRRIGGECAGALSVVEVGAVEHATTRRSYQTLDDRRLTQLVGGDVVPLLVGGTRTRLSLAGAQDKLPVALIDGELRLPLDGAPSTHILKLPNQRYAHLPENEAFMLGLAAELGLDVVTCELVTRTDPPSLLVTRYDRQASTEEWPARRLHQEDVCQALGLPPTRKYEHEGGPTLVGAVTVVRDAVADPIVAVRRLIEWQAFNVVAGNSDGHAKNLSLLYDGAATSLAPFYDLVCTRAYRRLDRSLAMSVGGRADPDRLGRAHWHALARELHVGERVVTDVVSSLAVRCSEIMARWTATFRDRYGALSVLQTQPRLIRRLAERVARGLGA